MFEKDCPGFLQVKILQDLHLASFRVDFNQIAGRKLLRGDAFDQYSLLRLSAQLNESTRYEVIADKYLIDSAMLAHCRGYD